MALELLQSCWLSARRWTTSSSSDAVWAFFFSRYFLTAARFPEGRFLEAALLLPAGVRLGGGAR